jgi:hypothetical protein
MVQTESPKPPLSEIGKEALYTVLMIGISQLPKEMLSDLAEEVSRMKREQEAPRQTVSTEVPPPSPDPGRVLPDFKPAFRTAYSDLHSKLKVAFPWESKEWGKVVIDGLVQDWIIWYLLNAGIIKRTSEFDVPFYIVSSLPKIGKMILQTRNTYMRGICSIFPDGGTLKWHYRWANTATQVYLHTQWVEVLEERGKETANDA